MVTRIRVRCLTTILRLNIPLSACGGRLVLSFFGRVFAFSGCGAPGFQSVGQFTWVKPVVFSNSVRGDFAQLDRLT
jgi:hypothetical protein